MARLTRKFLTALNIEDENIQDQIVEAHAEAVNALKAQRDEYKEAFDKLPQIEGELATAQADLEAYRNNENPYKKQYETLKSEFENYKTDVEKSRVLSLKKAAYEKLLKDVKISEDAVDSILSVTNFDELELDGENIKNSETVKENVKGKWKGFIVTTQTKGAQIETPPNNTGGASGMSKEDILKIKDPIARQKAIAENKGVFGI